MLHDTEKCYKMIEKVALTLIPLAQRLKPYFPSHQVVVKMNYPIKQVWRKPELAGRMVGWSINFQSSTFSMNHAAP